MVLNFPGPYQLRTEYTVNGVEHKMAFNLKVDGTPAVGSTFADISVIAKDTTLKNLDTVATELQDHVRALFHNLTDFAGWELWKYEPLSFDATFVSGRATAFSGTKTSTSESQQMIYTFRTQEGGILKFITMEQQLNRNNQLRYPDLTADEKLLVDYFLATDAWIVARDTSYPVLFLKASGGQNEKIWRIRNRS